MLGPRKMTPVALPSIEVALIESVSMQVQYKALPRTSNTMWKGLAKSVTTGQASVTVEVEEYEIGTLRIAWESSSIQYKCLFLEKMYAILNRRYVSCT